MTDLVMLTALLRGPAYGYALKKTAGLIFGSTAMHNNVIYPTLKKFTRKGWVEQNRVPGDRGQHRKQYRLTAAGRRFLLGQLATFGDREASDEGEFLLRVAAFDVLPKPRREAILASRKAFLRARAAQLSELQETARPSSFGAVALHRVQTLVENELRWVSALRYAE
jgi:DNA-binding PadR family transcriptional regulator